MTEKIILRPAKGFSFTLVSLLLLLFIAGGAASAVPSVAVSSDSVPINGAFLVTVTGSAGDTVVISYDDSVALRAGQIDVLAGEGNISFTLGQTGTKTLAFSAGGLPGTANLTAVFNGDSAHAVTVGILITKGMITMSSDKEVYYIVDTLTLSGTSNANSNLWFYFTGPNLDLQELRDTSGSQVTAKVLSDGTWECSFVFKKKLESGTYLIYAVSGDEILQRGVSGVVTNPRQLANCSYASLGVALTTPYITASVASSVVAQSSNLQLSVEAAGAGKVQYYIFGNNLFESAVIPVRDDGSYKTNISVSSARFAPGQYFIVVQHPMYDQVFNIGPVLSTGQSTVSYDITLNPYGSFDAPEGTKTVLFNTRERQSFNAADALCYGLDMQNIDDIYAKLTFIVAIPTASMNPATDVVKGSALKVSGTTNIGAGETVCVEMLSTAFAAIPKESVNSASFISLVTKVAEGNNGVNTWEVTFDTTGLNVDEYTLSATVGGIKTSSVVVKVLDSIPVTPDIPIPTDDISSISLCPGWNFISVPKYLNSSVTTAGTLFAGLNTGGRSHLGYNAELQAWETLSAGQYIEPLTGYWIYSENKTTLNLSFANAPATPKIKSVYPGWNAVGLSAENSVTAATALSGIEWRVLIPWNLSAGAYGNPIIKDGSAANSPLNYMTYGNGCWLYATQEGTLLGLTA